MDKATSEPRCCEVCGGPIKRNNRYGICDTGKSECRKARLRKQREANPRPEPKSCEVCARPIRSDNEMGICQRSDSPACKAARWRKLQQEGPMGRFRYCEVCGCLLRRDNAAGVCSGRGSAACAQERDRRRRAGTAPARGTWTPPPYIAAGAVFTRLTVLKDVRRSQDPAFCHCECGTEKQIPRAVYLTIEATRSCGCLRRERSTTHGFSKHPLYVTWNGIMQRTANPNDIGYPNYGGRGIKISERWQDPWLFAEDIGREIGPRPEGVGEGGLPLYSLDRINVDGDYEEGNVRWATQSVQLINRRKVPVLTEQRDALAAQVEMLTAALQAVTEQIPPKRKEPAPDPDTLF